MKKACYKDWTFVSLGCDCETDFRFRHYNKNIRSFFFSYASILDPFSFIDVLQNIDSPLDETFEPFKTGMMRSVTDSLCFHVKGNREWPITHFSSESEAFLSRLRHLKEKTNQLFENENSHIVFVQKVPYHWISQSYFTALLRALDSAVRGDFRIVVVTEKQYQKDCLRYLPVDKRLLVEGVKHFDIPTKRGDLWGWLRICRKYSSGSALRYIFSASPFLRNRILPLLFRLRRLAKGA